MVAGSRSSPGFPISRDPPEGGTSWPSARRRANSCFQFLGIPPKGEQKKIEDIVDILEVSNF